MKNVLKLLFSLLLLTNFCFAQNNLMSGVVVKVKDGDTVEILDDNKVTYNIRLAGVDCPEKNQDFGVVAKKFTSDLIFGKSVKFQILKQDLYGRNIGWVFIDDLNVSEELLRNGLAWHYVKYSTSKRLQILENLARSKKIGIWSKPDPVKPWEFRKKR